MAEITGLLDLDSWPEGSRAIVRRERPHPGGVIDGHPRVIGALRSGPLD